MAGSEDYLDDLLASVGKAKTESSYARDRDSAAQDEKIAQRNRISPDDDFFTANRFDEFQPRTIERKNLNSIFSENDFLKSFEAELESGEADDFLTAFENELFAEANPSSDEDEAFESTDNYDNGLAGDFDVDMFPEGSYTDDLGKPNLLSDSYDDNLVSNEDEPEIGLLENIENIVSETKEQFDSTEALLSEESSFDEISEDDIKDESANTEDSSSDDEPLSADDLLSDVQDILAGEGLAGDDSDSDNSSEGELDLEESFLPDEFAADELDLEGGADDGESPYLSEDADLDSLLEGDDAFSDLSSLLNADSNDEMLDEALEEYDNAAEAIAEGAEGTEEEGKKSKKAKGKKGGFADKIKATFEKLFKQTETDDDYVEIYEEGFESHNAENQEIIKNFEKAEQEALAKAEKKEEKARKKEEAKAAKAEAKALKAEAKKNKPPKEKKEKKPKQPGGLKLYIANSPKIPLGFIGIFVILAVSLSLFVLIFGGLLSYNVKKAQAEAFYSKQEYVNAYEIVAGMNMQEKDPDDYNRIRLLADLENSIDSYNTFMNAKKYDYALDELICGYARYEDNHDQANSLGIQDEYNAMGNELLTQLTNQFNLDSQSALEIYSSTYREQYSRRIYEVLDGLGLGVN